MDCPFGHGYSLASTEFFNFFSAIWASSLRYLYCAIVHYKKKMSCLYIYIYIYIYIYKMLLKFFLKKIILN